MAGKAFRLMARNAVRGEHLLPPASERVVELGVQVEMLAAPPDARRYIYGHEHRRIGLRRSSSLSAVSAVAASARGGGAVAARAVSRTDPAVHRRLGTFTRPISSTNKDAQAFFTQGFQMM